MEVVIDPSPRRLADIAADVIETQLRRRPDTVLGLATGSSPLLVYQALAHRYAIGDVSFRHARAFLLDEYVGLPPGHPQSYRRVIQCELTDHVDFSAGAVQGPDGNAADLARACTEYERAIASAGGVDVQLLGVGADGHVAFNEPISSFGSRTRIKTLTARTRQDNARFFEGDLDAVPRHALTQGIATIMEAKHLILLASGSAKAEAIQHLVEGPVSALWPVTALQHHPHVTVLIDEAAASRLQLAQYYRETWISKPAWQEV